MTDTHALVQHPAVGNELGRELSVHRGSPGQHSAMFLIGAVLAPWILCVPYAVAHDLVTTGGRELMANPALTFGCFPVLLFAGPALLALPVLRWRQKVVVHERGLVHRTLRGVTVVYASEVTGARRLVRRARYGDADEISIGRRDGSNHLISGVADMAHLTAVIEAWAVRDNGTTSSSEPTPPQIGGWVPPSER